MLLLVLASLSAPLTQEPARIFQAPPVRDLGTYHVATGTREPGGSFLGTQDILYRNDYTAGYFAAVQSNESITHSSRLPSTQGSGAHGTADWYTIEAFTISWCASHDAGPAGITATFTWYDSVDSCQMPQNEEHTDVVVIPNLPSTSGLGSCWVMTVDLSGGQELVVRADADGVFDDNPPFYVGDTFSYSLQFDGGQPSGGGSSASIGPLLAGSHAHDTSPSGGYGTKFNTSLGDIPYTGLGKSDRFWIAPAPSAGGTGTCAWYGGPSSGVYAGHFFRLYGSDASGDPPSNTFCGAKPNSTGGVSDIDQTGSASLAANDLVLIADDHPNQIGIFIASTGQAELPFFNGILCLAPSGLQRLIASVSFPSNGVATHAVDYATSAGGPISVMAGSAHYYQRWYRDSAAGGGNANFSTGLEVHHTP